MLSGLHVRCYYSSLIWCGGRSTIVGFGQIDCTYCNCAGAGLSVLKSTWLVMFVIELNALRRWFLRFKEVRYLVCILQFWTTGLLMDAFTQKHEILGLSRHHTQKKIIHVERWTCWEKIKEIRKTVLSDCYIPMMRVDFLIIVKLLKIISSS